MGHGSDSEKRGASYLREKKKGAPQGEKSGASDRASNHQDWGGASIMREEIKNKKRRNFLVDFSKITSGVRDA